MRTVAALILFMMTFAVNTAMALALDYYSTWYAWVVVAVAIPLLVVALRFQHRLSVVQMAGLFVLPCVLAITGAFLLRG